MKLKIGIDIDGVITDFVEAFIEVVKEKYNRRFGEEDIGIHDLYQVLGIREKEALELINYALQRDLNPQKDAVEAINKLYKTHKIFLITARPKHTLDITKKWLKKHRVKYHRLIYLDEGSKHELEEDLDVVIDDHLKEIMRWVGKVPTVIVFNHPWNKSLNVKEHFIRAYNWKDILEFLKSY